MTGLVVDTSAIIAILRDEPEKDRYFDAMLQATPCLMSAVSLQEARMVVAGRDGGEDTWQVLDAMIAGLGLEVVAHDANLARVAGQAFLQYGKGRHRARLNFGDCAAYALAKTRGMKLLFKGNDFSATDVPAAV